MDGYRIVRDRQLAEKIREYWIEAPMVAKKHRAGQFVIIRLHEHGERIPFTVVQAEPERGLIRLISQSVGKTTEEFAEYHAGDSILDVVGPLGRATHMENWGDLVVVAGGVGAAPLLPIVKAAKSAGNRVHAVIGARSKDMMILEDEFRKVCDEVRVCTDDGTHGSKGLVTDVLRSWAAEGKKFVFGITVGPVIMMKATADAMRELSIPGLASLNPIMVDGTGMCGACRVTVHGKTRFACVEGPEFDALGVDFQELILRNRAYRKQETEALDHYHSEGCRLLKSAQELAHA
jgi:ferredoxin--NADP+ reductase